MDVASRLFEYNWINHHGPPAEVSSDPEFHNTDFVPVLEKHGIKYNATPVRRHNKTGCVESGNTTLRVLTERLLADAQHYQSTKGLMYTEHEILPKAVLLTNVLHGQKNCSAFELARGYFPALCGLPQMPLNKDIVNAHHERVVRRALSKLLRSNLPRVITNSILTKGQPIYFFEKKAKQGVWNIGYVQDPRWHYAVVSRTKKRQGKPLKIAYEDIMTIPNTFLLHEIDKLDLEVGANDGEPPNDQVNPIEELNEKASSAVTDRGTGNVPTSRTDNVLSQSKANENKDISASETILRQIRDSIGDEPVSESRLQFAPRWIVDKAIEKERNNYTQKKAYEEINIRDLHPNSNLISSHHFFQIKMDGSEDRLKLKCRLVPHGNRDKDKEFIRKDSTTAQFPVLRSLLSAAAIFNFDLATIDISGAFLQAVTLNRDVFVRLPKGWTKCPLTVWRLLLPAYGLVESGRLWQNTVELWMKEVYSTETVQGFVQLFVVRKDSKIILIVAKIVDDFLIAGQSAEIYDFHQQIAKRFQVGRFICDEDLVQPTEDTQRRRWIDHYFNGRVLLENSVIGYRP